MLDFTDESAPHQIALEAYGTQLRVCANSTELLARAEALLPPGWQPCAPSPVQPRVGILAEAEDRHSVYKGGTCVSDGQGLELSLVVLDGQIRGHVALNSPDKTFVHAGAVAHEGRAIIFPGHSFSGKTTLVAAMVRAGATYYSDEFAVFDAEGLVHPYAKSLSLREGPDALQSEYSVEQLGGVAGEEPVPLGLAVVTYYHPGAEWRPERISPGAAALSLLSNTVTVRARPDAALRALTRALTGAIALEGERGEADEIVDRLLASASV